MVSAPAGMLKNLVPASLSIAMVATLGLWASSAGAQSAPAETYYTEEIRLRAPERADLGEQSSVDIQVEASGDQPPTLVSNVGSLGELRRTSAKQYVVTYTLPEKKFPQWAIIAALGERQTFGWTKIALMRHASVVVESEPHVEVRVRVRESEFGPVKADARGQAKLDVVVPPGLEYALSVAIDAMGNASHRRVPLGVPPSSRLLLHCPTNSQHVLAFAVTPEGSPMATPSFSLTGSVVKTQRPNLVAQGVFMVPFEVPDEVETGEVAEFEARTKGGGGSSCSMPVPLEAPRALKLSASRNSLTADDAGSVVLTADWEFLGARNPRQVQPLVSVSLGSVVSVEQTSPTRHVITWRIPPFFSGASKAEATVSFKSENTLSATQEVELSPGRLRRLDISVPEQPLPANGLATGRLRVAGYDAHGNRSAIRGLKLVRSKGRVSNFQRQADGSFGAEYVALESDALRLDEIVVEETESGVRGTAGVQLRPQAGRIWGFARLGYLHNFGKVRAPLGVLGLGARLPFFDGSLAASVGVGIYQSDTEALSALGGAGSTETVEISVTGVPLLVRAEYQIPWDVVTFYPGVELGALISSASASAPAIGKQEARGASAVLGGIVGASFALGPGRPMVELGYWYAKLDQAWINGNAGGLHGTVGYLVSL